MSWETVARGGQCIKEVDTFEVIELPRITN
jgi:hypothetical protein